MGKIHGLPFFLSSVLPFFPYFSFLFFCLFFVPKNEVKGKGVNLSSARVWLSPFHCAVVLFALINLNFFFFFLFFSRKSLNTLQDVFVLVFVVISQLSPLLSLLIRSVH